MQTVTTPAQPKSIDTNEMRASADKSARNGVTLFRERVARTPGHTAVRWKVNGAWKQATWREWNQASLEIAHGLRALGVEIGDRVAILSNSRVEWFYADIGVLLAGAVSVPIYQSNLAHECDYVINNSGAKIVFAEDPAQVQKLMACKSTLGSVARVIYFDDSVTLPRPDEQNRSKLTISDVVSGDQQAWTMSLTALRELGRKQLQEEVHARALETSWSSLSPQSILTIVYTSGTTGPPKGVVLTHGNLVWECAALDSAMPIDESDEQLLFLPLAHIFARALEWTSIVRGTVTAFAESIAQLRANMSEVRPTYMCAVPRVLEKVYLGVLGNRNASSFLKQRIFDWAFAVGRKVSEYREKKLAVPMALGLQYTLATRLVFQKIQVLFGGRLRFLVSGGAPLSPEIARFFHAAGILVLEGWGLTETFAGTCLNRMDDYAIGTVGPAVAGVELRIADDGEILVRGGSVMKEYYRLPEATREVLDADGWFHTGDIGEMRDNKLRITDRKKDLIVTSGGKKVPPQNLENALKSTPYISQVMVYGDTKPYLIALITLNEENLGKWAREQRVPGQNAADWAGQPAVQSLIQKYVSELNAREPSYSTIKKFVILPADFSQETGELTPTLKVKRKFTTQKYQQDIDRLY